MDGIGWIQMEVTPIIKGVPVEVGDKEVQERPDKKYYLDIVTPSIEKVYDGKPIDEALLRDYSISCGDTLPGHTIWMTYANDGPVNAGSVVDNKILKVRITDEEGNDVTDSYALNIVSGTLKILKREITINSIDASKRYDGKPLTDDTWWISSGSLVKGHSLEVTVKGTITDPGSVNNSFSYTIVDESGKNVTSQYDVKTVYGILRVYS